MHNTVTCITEAVVLFFLVEHLAVEPFHLLAKFLSLDTFTASHHQQTHTAGIILCSLGTAKFHGLLNGLSSLLFITNEPTCQG